LRRQSIQRVLGIESDAGLADCLVDGKPLRECIIWPRIDKFTLISGGRRIQNSTELLGSSKMRMLVEEMKNRYDDRYVLFDVPPILAGADALALAPFVDCVILVVEQGRTGMRGVEKAVEMIPKEKFLGFVLNRQKGTGADGYGYYYYR
jgi:protein-tyrosine kinase